MSELPEDARQAAVEAIIGEESGYCGPGYGTCGSLHVSSEHAPALADAALAAAFPFLERATRDKIADEIDGFAEHAVGSRMQDGVRAAARVARGGEATE